MVSFSGRELRPRSSLFSFIDETASQREWDKLKNGDLLRAAQEAGFEVLITPDKNVRYQQNLQRYTIAIVVLGNPQWPVLRHYVDRVAMNLFAPGMRLM